MAAQVAVAAALASAVCAAAGSVLQHRSAALAPPDRGPRLLRYLACRPAWLVGVAASSASLGLHALALSAGQLVIVQPLLATTVIFALPAAALAQHRPPSATEAGWALLLVAGLAAFLYAARPSGGTTIPAQRRLELLLILAVALAATLVLLGAYRMRRHRASLFGLATGIGYGAVAGLLKYTAGLAGHHPLRLATAWQTYALITLGAGALMLNQVAYQAGPLAAVFPPLTIADPIIAVVIGATTFGEHVAAAPAALAGELAGFTAMSLAITRLAHGSDLIGPPP